MPQEKKFQIDDANIIWPNFEGKPTPFKPAGHRTFNIVLPKDKADELALEGWNVKCKLPDEEHAEEFCFIEVQAKYRNKLGEKVKPPKIVVISSAGRTHLNEDNVEILDSMDIKTVDVIVRAYEYDVNGKQGISAYLKTMYVTIDEDELDRKYADKVKGV